MKMMGIEEALFKKSPSIKVIIMTWKDTIRKQGAEKWNCGCGVDYEGPDPHLVHYPCEKYERDEVCEFAIDMYRRNPKYVERNLTRRGKTEKLSQLKGRQKESR